MRNNQKAKLKQPVIALLLNSRDNARKNQSREPSQVKSRKSIKIIHTKSDNRDGLKDAYELPSIKNLRSQKILRNYQQKIQQLDQYGMRRNPQDFKSHKIIDNKYNQCLRDQDQSSQHQQIMSHYRRSKSRYKNAKDKAKKLIENLRSGSRNNYTQQSQNQTQNQDYFKTTQKKEQLINKKPILEDHYEMEIRSIGKASSSSSFRPKKQKSSTIKWKKEDLSKMLKKSSLNICENSGIIKNLDEKTEKQSEKNSTKRQTTTITNTTSVGGSSNKFLVPGENMVVKAKQLVNTQYGIGNYSDKKKNNLQSVTQKKDQTLSHKILTTQRNQKESQKILRRSRQKNKKIIGKLREKTSFLKVPDYDQLLNPHKYNTNAKNLFNTSQKQIQKSNIQQFSMLNSNFLMLNSKLNRSQTYLNEEIKQKILIHLETLNMIGDYAQSFRSIYDDCEQWEELIFLLYKKYFIQRIKVYMIMRNGCIKFDDFINTKKSNNNDYQQKNIQTESPFVFDFCKVTLEELNSFRESKQEVNLELEVQNYNKSIKVALRQLYNQFIEKTSKNSYINMYQVDDFSQEIIEDLNEEINMLIQSSGKSKTLKKRINLAIQIGLIVAHLGGYHLEQIQDIVTGQVQKSQFYNKYYSRFMNIFEQNQKNSQQDQQ